MADLKAMSYTEGWGGWKNQLGNITAPTYWRGVSVTALMDLVGGGSSIVVVASDGYEQSVLRGRGGRRHRHVRPGTGDTITSITAAVSSAIVAYSQNGAPIGSDYGPTPHRVRESETGPGDRRYQLGEVGRRDQSELANEKGKERL